MNDNGQRRPSIVASAINEVLVAHTATGSAAVTVSDSSPNTSSPAPALLSNVNETAAQSSLPSSSAASVAPLGLASGLPSASGAASVPNSRSRANSTESNLTLSATAAAVASVNANAALSTNNPSVSTTNIAPHSLTPSSSSSSSSSPAESTNNGGRTGSVSIIPPTVNSTAATPGTPSRVITTPNPNPSPPPQLSKAQKEEERQREELSKEWSKILSKWHEYQRQPPSSNTPGTKSSVSYKDLLSNQKKLSTLLYTSGVPTQMRASVWMAMIGNALQITPQIFEELKMECETKRAVYEAWHMATHTQLANQENNDTAEHSSSKHAQQSPSANNSQNSANAVVSPPSEEIIVPNFHTSPSPTGSPAPDAMESPNGHLHFSPAPSMSPVDSLHQNLPPSNKSSSSSSNAAAETDPFSPFLIDASFTMFSLIDQDLPRTFPEFAFFHDDGPYEAPLRTVLECASLYRMRLRTATLENPTPTGEGHEFLHREGYVQGMSFLAGILLLALGDDAFLTFLYLVNLLENPSERVAELFHIIDSQSNAILLCKFDKQFALSLPALRTHFSHNVQLESGMFLWKWILPVFSQSLQLDTLMRVWDVFLWESFKSRGITLGEVKRNRSASEIFSSIISPSSSTAVTSSSASITAVSSAAISSISPDAIVVPTNPDDLPVNGEGFSFLFRVALGILSYYQSVLLQSSFEEALHLLQHLPDKSNAGSHFTNDGLGALLKLKNESVEVLAAQRIHLTIEPLDATNLFFHIRSIQMEKQLWNEPIRPSRHHHHHHRNSQSRSISYSSYSPHHGQHSQSQPVSSHMRTRSISSANAAAGDFSGHGSG